MNRAIGRRRDRREYYSRQLWNATKRDNNHNVSSQARAAAIIRALLYEIQPISFSKLCKLINGLFRDDFVELIISVASFLRTYLKQIIFGSGVSWAYFQLLKYAHEKADAGPLVSMLTVLVLIFTFGLADNEVAGRRRISPYSVFNRGVEMLGNLNAESLVAQHVGLQVAPQREHDRGQEAAHEREHDQRIEANLNEIAHTGPSRKSGKKARNRRNLESRRDRQTQREMAREMGFGGDANIDANDLAAIQVALNEAE